MKFYFRNHDFRSHGHHGISVIRPCERSLFSCPFLHPVSLGHLSDDSFLCPLDFSLLVLNPLREAVVFLEDHVLLACKGHVLGCRQGETQNCWHLLRWGRSTCRHRNPSTCACFPPPGPPKSLWSFHKPQHEIEKRLTFPSLPFSDVLL